MPLKRGMQVPRRKTLMVSCSLNPFLCMVSHKIALQGKIKAFKVLVHTLSILVDVEQKNHVVFDDQGKVEE